MTETSRQRNLLFLAIVMSSFSIITSNDLSEFTQKYIDNDLVILWVDGVGPYDNPQEKYYNHPALINYYRGGHQQTLGEALRGVYLQNSGVKLPFKANLNTTYSELRFDEWNLQPILRAVKERYYSRMFIDDLLVQRVVGEYNETDDGYYLWTHMKLDIGYNADRVVDVNLTNERKVKLESQKKWPFTYEVNWIKSDLKYEEKLDKYLTIDLFMQRIRWLSILCTLVMAFIIIGLVCLTITRTSRKMCVKYSEDEEMNSKVVTNVFRSLAYPVLISALAGIGFQAAMSTLWALSFATMSHPYAGRASFLDTVIYVYVATAPVNGYFGGSLYTRMGGITWIKQMLLGTFMLPALFYVMYLFIILVSSYYGAYYYYPSISINAWDSLLKLIVINLVYILPLTMMGTLVGRNLTGQPARARPWFRRLVPFFIMSGILPFMTFVIEGYLETKNLRIYRTYQIYIYCIALIFLFLTIVVFHVPWMKKLLWRALISPVLVYVTYVLLEFYKTYNHLLADIPLNEMVTLTVISFVIILLLTLMGPLVGTNLTGQQQAKYPSQGNFKMRPIPDMKWLTRLVPIISGILPFMSIVVEISFIFASVWTYKMYNGYGLTLIVFLILTTVTCCVSILSSLLLANYEDHRWQWSSFFSGVSTGGYVFLYSVYYFFFETQMYGLYQTVYYFAQMTHFCVLLAVMCGTFGYIASCHIICKIYAKMDNKSNVSDSVEAGNESGSSVEREVERNQRNNSLWDGCKSDLRDIGRSAYVLIATKFELNCVPTLGFRRLTTRETNEISTQTSDLDPNF